MRHIIAAALVAAGLGVVGYVALDDTGDDVGDVTITAAADPDSRASDIPTPMPSSDDGATAAPAASPSESASTAAPSLRPSAPDIGRSSARLGDVDLSPPPAPVDLALPSIAVDATVVPVGIDPDGLMTVPENVDQVGWYRFGSTPASEAGTTVLAGHVDSRVQGRGAFFDLRVVDVGDEVTLVDDEGASTTWRVTGRRTYEKDSLPIADLYDRDGPRRLVLITCGGDFDAEARSYRSNVVVEAEPVA